jgi:hypothetical protein
LGEFRPRPRRTGFVRQAMLRNGGISQMKLRTRNLLSVPMMVIAIALCTPSAHAEEHKMTVRAGYLTCHVASGWGLFSARHAR